MSGALMNYDFGPKRHWRRWVWNRISEKVPNRRDALVLYLAGSNDFDRPIAISKGFSGSNMVAVERDPQARATLRHDGVLTADADFFDAVGSQYGKRSIGVVFGDLCCGLHANMTLQVAHWAACPTMTETVFAFNLLRGRDPSTNRIRDSSTRLFHDVLKDDGKHRGKQMAVQIAMRLGSSLFAHMHPRLAKISTPAERAEWYECAKTCFESLDAEFCSYKSDSGQVFDSVVFQSPGCGNSSGFASTKEKDEYSNAFRKMQMHIGRNVRQVTSARQSMAAVLAHRTRRMCLGDQA